MKSEYLDCDALCVGLSEQADSLDPNHIYAISSKERNTVYVTSLKPSEVRVLPGLHTFSVQSHMAQIYMVINLVILNHILSSYIHIYKNVVYYTNLFFDVGIPASNHQKLCI